MINFFHRIFITKTEDELRLESLRTTNDQIKENNIKLREINDRIGENNLKLRESVNRLRNKRRTPD